MKIRARGCDASTSGNIRNHTSSVRKESIMKKTTLSILMGLLVAGAARADTSLTINKFRHLSDVWRMRSLLLRRCPRSPAVSPSLVPPARRRCTARYRLQPRRSAIRQTSIFITIPSI